VKGCALIGAEKAANASGYATNHTAHDSADRAANGVTFRRAAFHPAGNSLCRGRDGRSEQTPSPPSGRPQLRAAILRSASVRSIMVMRVSFVAFDRRLNLEFHGSRIELEGVTWTSKSSSLT
jgi:hypothetical protein